MSAAPTVVSAPTGDAVPLTLHVQPRVDSVTVYQGKSLQRRRAPLSFMAPMEEVQVMVPMPTPSDLNAQPAFDRDSVQVEFGASYDGNVILAGVVVDEVDQKCLRKDGTVDVAAARLTEVESASDAEADGHDASGQSSAAERHKLQVQLRELEQKLQLNKIAREEANTIRNYAVDIANGAVELGNGAALMSSDALHQPSMWEAHLDTLESAKRQHAKTARELIRAGVILEEEKAVVEASLANLGARPPRGGQQRMASTVTVVVLTLKVLAAVPAGPEAAVYVSYLVASGSWSATYEAHLNTETNEVALYYNAEVSLNSGDDLRDVKLTLSSAMPRRNAALPPSMTIWRCGVEQQREIPLCGSANHNFNVASLMRAEEEVAPMPRLSAPMAPMMLREAAVAEQVGGSGAIMNFTMPSLQTVMANGKVVRLSLTELRMPATISYVSVPEKSLAFFTHAKIKNTSQFLLLAGDVAVFLDGNYVTRSHLDTPCASGAMAEMYFGADPTVEIKRVLLRQANRKANNSYFKGKKRNIKVYTYKITVWNKKRASTLSNGAVNVKVIEHIPISNEEQLQVRLLSPPNPQEEVYIFDDADDKAEQVARKERALRNEGIVEIERTVAAGQKVEVTFEFEVEAPSTETIYGL